MKPKIRPIAIWELIHVTTEVITFVRAIYSRELTFGNQFLPLSFRVLEF